VLAFDKIMDVVQIYAVLLDPDGGFRGHVQCPGGPGPRRLVIRVGADTTPGCVPGPIPAGRWTVRLDLDRHKRAAPYELTVRGRTADGETPVRQRPERERAPATGGVPGWYRGLERDLAEIHAWAWPEKTPGVEFVFDLPAPVAEAVT